MAEITVATEFIPRSNHADLLIIHESHLIMDNTNKVQIPKEYQKNLLLFLKMISKLRK